MSFKTKWKSFAIKSSDMLAHMILFLFYFIIFTPYTSFLRLFKDFLCIKKQNSYWVEREQKSIESYKEQY